MKRILLALLFLLASAGASRAQLGFKPMHQGMTIWAKNGQIFRGIHAPIFKMMNVKDFWMFFVTTVFTFSESTFFSKFSSYSGGSSAVCSFLTAIFRTEFRLRLPLERDSAHKAFALHFHSSPSPAFTNIRAIFPSSRWGSFKSHTTLLTLKYQPFSWSWPHKSSIPATFRSARIGTIFRRLREVPTSKNRTTMETRCLVTNPCRFWSSFRILFAPTLTGTKFLIFSPRAERDSACLA